MISNRLSRGDDLPPSMRIGGIRRWHVEDASKWTNAELFVAGALGDLDQVITELGFDRPVYFVQFR